MSDVVNVNKRPNRSYKLVGYDPKWVDKYNHIAAELKPLFGTNLVWMEHGGSTSVPGMIAKPQIDVYINVKDLDKVKSIYKQMEEKGFKCWGDYIQKDEPEEYFTRDEDGHRAFSIHVMQDGNFQLDDTIIFRDYLRASAAARDSYSNHKLKLMKEYTDQDYNAYGRGKIDFLEDLKVKAREWDKAGRPQTL